MADPAVIALDVLQSSVVLLCVSPTPSSLLPLTFTTQCCQTRKCFSFFFFFFKSLRAKLLAGILIDFFMAVPTEHILGSSSRSRPTSRACGRCLLEAAYREVHPGWWVSSHNQVMFSWVVNHRLLHRSVFWNPFLLPLKLQHSNHTDDAHGYLHHSHLTLGVICEAGVLNPSYSYIGNAFAVHNIISMSRRELTMLRKAALWIFVRHA